MINPLETNALACRTTVTELARAWNESVQDIKDGFAKIVTAEERMQHFFEGGNRSLSFQRYGARDYLNFKDPDPEIEHFKREVWASIVERLELRKILSLKRLEELDKQLKTGEGLPDITVNNINAMLETNLGKMGDYLQEKVLEVYEYLRPRNTWRPLVTNAKSLEAGVGPKVILGWAVESNYSGGYRVNYHRDDRIRALDQVFHLLDGKAPPASYHGELADAINKTTYENNTFDTTYFRGRCFRNHNLHLEFKREDLLARLNAIAGGARLTDVKKFNQT